MGLCEKFKKESQLKPLYMVDAYYNILVMLESGNFDINRFLGEKSGEKKDRDRDRDFDRDRDRERMRDRDRGRDRGFDKVREKRYGSFFGGFFDRKKKGKKRSLFDFSKKDRGSSSLFDRSSNKDRENTKKKMLFILKRERKGFSEKENEVLIEGFLQTLKLNGKDIFENKCINNDPNERDNYRKIIEAPSKEKQAKCNIKDSVIASFVTNAGNTKKLYEVLATKEEMDRREISIYDFYIGKRKTVENKLAKLQCKEIDVKRFFVLEDVYNRFYSSYNLGLLPRANDSALDREKTSVLILKGIGIYLSILREMLLLLEKRLFNDPALRSVENKIKNEERKKMERQSSVQENTAEFREYKEILREIDKQIFEERNQAKKNRLIQLREKVISRSQPITSNNSNQTNKNKKNTEM